LFVEHSLDIEGGVNVGEHLLLGGFEDIVLVDEAFVEGHLVVVEIVVDVSDSDELDNRNEGLLSIVVAVGKDDCGFEHYFFFWGVNTAGTGGGDCQSAV